MIQLAVRVLQVALATVWCALAAGPIFGFAALKPVLVAQQVYSSYCHHQDVINGVMCAKQEFKLNAAFSYAALAASVGTFLASCAVDKYGSRICSGLGCVLLAVGSGALKGAAGAMDKVPAVDPIVFGLCALAVGGPFVLVGSLHSASLFPRQSGQILALITGAADASSGVFAVYRYVYEHSYQYTLRQFFTVYLTVPAAIFVSQFFMPAFYKVTLGRVRKVAEITGGGGYEDIGHGDQEFDVGEERQPQRASEDETTRLLSNSLNQDGYDEDEIDMTHAYSHANFSRNNRHQPLVNRTSTLNTVYKDPSEVSGVWGALHSVPAGDQVKSLWFVLLVVFAGVNTVLINYFIATMPSHYEKVLDSVAWANRLSHLFDIALPIGGIVAIPIVGIVLDNVPTKTMFGLLGLVSVVVAISGAVPSVFVAHVRVCLLVLFRPFLYTAISDYVAKVFGFDTFGLIYGTALLLSGLGNLFIPLLEYWRVSVFHLNPVPNTLIITTASFVSGLAFLLYLISQTRRIRRKQLEDEARNAPVQHMPGSPSCSSNGGCGDCVCNV